MSMYVPEIKEEVSENAHILVEDGGKVYRTGMSSGGVSKTVYYTAYGYYDLFKNEELDDKVTAAELEEAVDNSIVDLKYLRDGGRYQRYSLSDFEDSGSMVSVHFGGDSYGYWFSMYK